MTEFAHQTSYVVMYFLLLSSFLGFTRHPSYCVRLQTFATRDRPYLVEDDLVGSIARKYKQCSALDNELVIETK